MNRHADLGRRIAHGAMQASIYAVIAAGGTTAMAQTRDRTGLEEIVVTARKTQENVQDVPITVNVLSSDELSNRGAETVADIGALVPNVLWDDSGGGTLANRITMRGIASNASKNGFDPGVGVYIDEVYIANEIGFNGALLDVERVEVLKGPQGTLFGRNTTAGAISMTTRKPSLTDDYVEFDLTSGNYDLRQGRAVGNVTIGEAAALKVSGIYRRRDGYLHNIVTGKRDINDEYHYGGRAQLLLAPTPDLEILTTAFWFHDEGSAEAQTCWGTGTANCSVRHPTRESVVDGVGEDNASESERNMWGGAVRLNYSGLGANEIVSITSYQELDAFNDQDQDYTALNVIRSGFSVPQDWQFSQELRIATAQDRRFRAVGGLYYFREAREAITPLTYGPTSIAAFGGPPGQSGTALTHGKIDTESMALFGQGQYDLTSTLTAELGLRYTRDGKDFTYVQTLSPALLAIPLASRNANGVPLAVPQSSESDSWGEVTGATSLGWRPTDDLLFYGRYARGYKSGGFQNAQSNPDAQGVFLATVPFGPEIMDQYEVGVRSELFDRRLRLNLSVFRMDYSDIQLQTTNENFAKFVTNAGDVRSEGAELELSALVFDSLTVFGNAGVVDSKFVKMKAGGDQTLVGRELAYSPEVTGSLGFTFDRQVTSEWDAIASFVGTHRSEIFLNNSGTVSSPSLTLVNGRVGVQSARGWGVFLYGANLFDERRITAFSGPKAGLARGAARPSTPRTFGIEISGRF